MKKRFFLFFFLAFMIGALLVVKLFLMPKEVKLEVISVSPAWEIGQVQIRFNRSLKDEKEIKVTIFPETPYQTELDPSKTLLNLVLLEELKAETKYLLEFYQQPKNTLIYSWSFTTRPPVLERGDPGYQRELQAYLTKNYPLLALVPFKSEKFELDYLDPLKLQVVLKGETSKKEVLDWIKSHGVDPSTHQIEWFTPSP